MVSIIIVAAGSGARFGASIPKQFCLLGGRPVLMHTIDALRAASHDARLLLVLSPLEFERWSQLCHDYGFESPQVVSGGDSRAESVKNALDCIDAGDDDIVMVHDGARPFPTKVIVEALTSVLADADGAIPVVPVTDSLRMIDDKGSRPADRSQYRAVQTPQAFRAALLKKAYDRNDLSAFTDDASLMESIDGCRLTLIDGNPTNIKITNPYDIAVAEAILKARQ